LEVVPILVLVLVPVPVPVLAQEMFVLVLFLMVQKKLVKFYLPTMRNSSLIMNVKASKYIYISEKYGQYALFHSIFMSLVFLTEDSYKIFCQIKEISNIEKFISLYDSEDKEKILSLVKCLIDKKLLVDINNPEKINTEKIISKQTIDIQIMYLIVTESCNLGCKYCFIEHSKSTPLKLESMSVQTIFKALEFFKEIAHKKRRIIFYGGEPFLNIKTIKKGIQFARNIMGDSVDITIITNGTKISLSDAEFIKEYNIEISISIDGGKVVNDSVRTFKNGKGIHDHIYRSIGYLKSIGINNIGASVTIGKHNYKDLVNHTKELLREFEFSSFGFNFIMDFPNKKNPIGADIKDATNELLNTFSFLRENGIYEDRIMRKLQPFVNSKLYLKDCGAIGNQIVVSPDGSLGPCHGFLYNRQFFSNDIWSENKLKSNIDFLMWSSRFPLNMEKCTNCEAISICGGGCAYQAFVTKGSIWELDERMCLHNKLFLEWAIWDVFNNINNIARH
jgi:uncharacterized protein